LRSCCPEAIRPRPTAGSRPRSRIVLADTSRCVARRTVRRAERVRPGRRVPSPAPRRRAVGASGVRWRRRCSSVRSPVEITRLLAARRVAIACALGMIVGAAARGCGRARRGPRRRGSRTAASLHSMRRCRTQRATSSFDPARSDPPGAPGPWKAPRRRGRRRAEVRELRARSQPRRSRGGRRRGRSRCRASARRGAHLHRVGLRKITPPERLWCSRSRLASSADRSVPRGFTPREFLRGENARAPRS